MTSNILDVSNTMRWALAYLKYSLDLNFMSELLSGFISLTHCKALKDTKTDTHPLVEECLRSQRVDIRVMSTHYGEIECNQSHVGVKHRIC